MPETCFVRSTSRSERTTDGRVEIFAAFGITHFINKIVDRFRLLASIYVASWFVVLVALC